MALTPIGASMPTPPSDQRRLRIVNDNGAVRYTRLFIGEQDVSDLLRVRRIVLDMSDGVVRCELESLLPAFDIQAELPDGVTVTSIAPAAAE